MDIVKQHLFLILCGVAGVAGIVLGITGISSMSKVRAEMQEAQQLHTSLTGLRSKPVNQRFIEQEQLRIEECAKNYQEVAARARQLNPYQPLIKDVFPFGKHDVRIEFRRKYNEAMQELLKTLQAGQRPSAAEIQEADDAIYRESAQLDAESSNDPFWTPTGVITEAGARRNAAARAAINRAQRIRIYAEPLGKDESSALQLHPEMRSLDSLEAPSLYDCWFAQVQLWIQTDVVQAIARLNDQVAQEYLARGENPWVGVLPVKDLVSLRVTDEYVTESSQAAVLGSTTAVAEARAPEFPPTNSLDTFTGSFSDVDGEFQVVNFTLKVVVDQRSLMKLIDEISRDRFHVLLRASYTMEQANPQMTGRIYGPDPAVLAVLDFETHMLGEIYCKLMPDSVLEAYGFPVPE